MEGWPKSDILHNKIWFTKILKSMNHLVILTLKLIRIGRIINYMKSLKLNMLYNEPIFLDLSLFLKLLFKIKKALF